MTRIGIIRHGSTVWNKEGRAQGSSDIPLDEGGLAEAVQLAERLSKEEWQAIYSSPLMRAKQTADAIASRMNGIEVQVDDRLREIHGGLIEGTTEAERIAKWGADWRELELGEEAKDVVLARMTAFIEDITNKHPNQNVLIVSHGAFIRNLLKQLIPHVNTEERLKNTSVTNILAAGSGWECELYNCTTHISIS